MPPMNVDNTVCVRQIGRFLRRAKGQLRCERQSSALHCFVGFYLFNCPIPNRMVCQSVFIAPRADSSAYI